MKYIDNQTIDVDTLIEITKLKMVSNTSFLNAFNEKLSLVKANLEFIPKGTYLTPTDDAFPIFAKRGCSFEQIANYSDSGKIYVDQEIYNFLNPLNQAALYIHESVYAMAREYHGDTSSVRSRKLTAYLTSTGDQGVIDELMRQIGEILPPPRLTNYQKDHIGSDWHFSSLNMVARVVRSGYDNPIQIYSCNESVYFNSPNKECSSVQVVTAYYRDDIAMYYIPQNGILCPMGVQVSPDNSKELKSIYDPYNIVKGCRKYQTDTGYFVN